MAHSCAVSQYALLCFRAELRHKLDASTGMFLREAERRVQECMLKRPSMLQPFATNILCFLSIFVIQDNAQAEQGQANKQRAGHVNCMTCLYFDVRNRILQDRMEFAQRCPLFPANHFYKVCKQLEAVLLQAIQ